MKGELWSLGLTGALVALAWLPASVAKYQGFGAKWLAGNRDPLQGKELPPWGARAERAHRNLLDFFPAYLAVLVILIAGEQSSPAISWASGLFFLGRLVHFVVYTAGWPLLRAFSWMLSMVSLAVLYGEAVRFLSLMASSS